MAKGYLYDNGDELITREDVNEVPDSSSAHAGDVLGLDSNKKPKWTTPESGLPDTSTASEGDVLSLNESKEPVWSTPSGGGGTIIPTYHMSWDASGSALELSFYAYNGETPETFEDVYSEAFEKDGVKFICVLTTLGEPVYLEVEEENGSYNLYSLTYVLDMISSSPTQATLACIYIGNSEISPSDTTISIPKSSVYTTTVSTPIE